MSSYPVWRMLFVVGSRLQRQVKQTSVQVAIGKTLQRLHYGFTTKTYYVYEPSLKYTPTQINIHTHKFTVHTFTHTYSHSMLKYASYTNTQHHTWPVHKYMYTFAMDSCISLVPTCWQSNRGEPTAVQESVIIGSSTFQTA